MQGHPRRVVLQFAPFGWIVVAYGPVMSSSLRVQVKIMMSHDPEGHLVIHIFFPGQAEAMMVAIHEIAMGFILTMLTSSSHNDQFQLYESQAKQPFNVQARWDQKCSCLTMWWFTNPRCARRVCGHLLLSHQIKRNNQQHKGLGTGC